MSYLPKDARRADLVRAAVSILENRGLGAVTSRAVAAEAGVSAGLVHHRFADTAELVAEAWRAYVERERAAFETGTAAPGRAAVETFFGNFAGDDRQALNLWADAWRYAQSQPTFAPVFAESFGALTQTLASALGEVDGARAAATRLLLVAFGIAGAQQIAPELIGDPAQMMAAAITLELGPSTNPTAPA